MANNGKEEVEEEQELSKEEQEKIIQKAIKAKEITLKALIKKGKSTQGPNERVPPGQHLSSKDFPVLDLGIRPKMNLNTWKLQIHGAAIKKELSLSLAELKTLGVNHFTEDFHCVTTWSKLDINWTGIPFKAIINFVKPEPGWKFLIQTGADDYKTNAPRDVLEQDNVFLAFELNSNPIPPDHGIIRIIIPHLYGWKSSKFLTGIAFEFEDQPGFWEKSGYHNVAQVWSEERHGH